MPRRDLPSHCCQWPRPCGEPLPTQASTGDPPTITGSFVSVSCGGGLFLSSGPYCRQDFVCALQYWSLCSPVLWKSHNQILLAFKVSFPGDSQSLCWIPSLGSLMWGFRTLTKVGELLWCHCSPVWVWPTQQVFDFIMIMPFLLSHCSFFFVFGEYLFLTGFLLMVINRWLWFLCSCRSTHPSTLPSWTRSQRITVKETLKCVGNAYTLAITNT